MADSKTIQKRFAKPNTRLPTESSMDDKRDSSHDRRCSFCRNPIPRTHAKNDRFCCDGCELKDVEMFLLSRSSPSRSENPSEECAFCHRSLRSLRDFALDCGCAYHEDCLWKIVATEEKTLTGKTVRMNSAENGCRNCGKEFQYGDYVGFVKLFRKKELRARYRCHLCRRLIAESQSEFSSKCKCVFHADCVFAKYLGSRRPIFHSRTSDRNS